MPPPTPAPDVSAPPADGAPRIPRPDGPPPAAPAGSLADRAHRILHQHADPDGRVAAGLVDLALLLDASTSSVHRALALLADRGDLQQTRPGITRRPAEYRVLTQPRGVVPRVPRQRGAK